MPTAAPTPDALPALLQPVPQLFGQAQLSLANHRKNLTRLLALHRQAAAVVVPSRKPGRPDKRVGELAFHEVFETCVARVLAVKKGVAVADRVVKFVQRFVGVLVEQDGKRESACQLCLLSSPPRPACLRSSSLLPSARLDDALTPALLARSSASRGRGRRG